MAGITRRALSAIAALALIGVAIAPQGQANAQTQSTGFTTNKPALLKPLSSGVTIKPIMSVGETLSNGYVMAAIPDGLGAFDNGDGTFTLYMNHELTSRSNLTDSRVSRLVIKKDGLQVVDGRYVVTGIEGYRRFCSATMVGPKEGFDHYYYLTGEEDLTGKYGGLGVVVDTMNDQVTQLVYMGRMAFENIIAVPGFKGKTVMMAFDDTAPGGVYMYVASSPLDVWTGKGDLYVFVADGGVRTEDAVTKTAPITGRFARIDQARASMYNQGLVQEAESAGFFKFVRPEDGAYDVNDPTAIYFNVTGRSSYTNTVTGQPYNAKGRTYSMKLDPNDPTRVTSLKVLLDGDAGDDILDPDNIAVSPTHIMILEDINAEFEGQHAGRVLAYEKATGKLTPVAELTHVDFAGQPIKDDKLGDWEASGIINASDLLGDDTWLLDVQAHTLKTDQFSGKDEGGQLLAITVPGSAAASKQSNPAPPPAVLAPPTQPGSTVPPAGASGQPPAQPPVSAPPVNQTLPAAGSGPAVANASAVQAVPGMPGTGQSDGDLGLYLPALVATGLASVGLMMRKRRVA